MPGSVAKAYVQIIPSAEGIKGKISGLLNKESGTAGTEAGHSLGSNLVSTIKTVIVAAGIGKVIKDSINEGAQLQQALGGVETLFKENADAVVRNAEQAYKTAGLSANEYMENVTSFSASLLQGLGGDTAKAAQIADMAMQDMSDNANKFGSDAKSIQNAYQGFAKQNYTMLDNLKLGYGGTKKEMERLLADAEAFSGVHYDIENLSDVYEAIHVIQGELDITGTTAKEASETLSGSAASMKASFKNLLGNLSLGRDISGPLNELQQSIGTFLRNLLPMFGQILGSLPTVLSSLLTAAINALEFGTDAIDGLVESGTNLIGSVVEVLANRLPELLSAGLQLADKLGEVLMNLDLGGVTDFGLKVVTQIATGIAENLPALAERSAEINSTILKKIVEQLPKIASAGIDILTTLANGILKTLPSLIPVAVDLIQTVLHTITSNLPQLLSKGIDMVLSIVNGIVDMLPSIVSAAGELLTTFLTEIASNLPALLQQGLELVAKLVEGLLKALPKVFDAADKLWDEIKKSVKSIDWAQLGRDLVQGIANGIKNGASAVANAAKEAARSALNSAKRILGIASPSKVMRDEVGKWIPAGMAVGIEANTKPLRDAMNDLSAITEAGINPASLTMQPMGAMAQNTTYGDTSVSISVYGTERQSAREIADEVMEQLMLQINRKKVAYA